jgi:CheY-like chemotaxis protein
VAHTLLLADDSVTIQRVIELTFADEDVTVIAVGDGDQAIERLEAAPPDIVLADIGMPGRNGYEVAQYMRQSPNLLHIPVVLLSGAFEPVDQARADAAGCDGVLAKPFEPQLVISRVRELLARPHAGHERATAQVADVAHEADAFRSASPAPVAESVDTSWAPEGPQDHGEASAIADVPRGGAASPPDLTDYFDQLDAAFARVKPVVAEPVARAEPSPPTMESVDHRPAPPGASGLDWYAAVGDAGREHPSAVPEHPAEVPAELAPLTDMSPQPEATVASPAAEDSFAAADRVEPVSEAPPFIEASPVVDYRSSLGPDERLSPIEESAPVETPPSEPAAEYHPSVVSPSAPAYSDNAAAFAAPLSASRLELPLPNVPPLPHLADAFAALLAAEQGEPLPTGALWPAAEVAPSAPERFSEETIDTITRRVLEKLSDSVVRQTVADMASTIAERVIREEIERIKAAIK